MLNVEIDDELRQVGLSREITNRIQKLRKAANVQPEDDLEVFYKLSAEASTKDAWLSKVVTQHGARVQKAIKRPFISGEHMPRGAPLIGETSFEYMPEGSKNAVPEVVRLYVCKPSPQVNPAAKWEVDQATAYGYLASFSQEGLQRHLK